MTDPVALITGGARRIGAATARTLHQAGYRIAIHCRHSNDDAQKLADELNAERDGSAAVFQADLADLNQVESLARQVREHWGRVDALINNASSFYPTPIGTATAEQWDDLLGSNVRAPFFLAQALAQALRDAGGAIVNMADIHADRPLKEHTIYAIAKAGNVMLTKSLAKELAPQVRVNGVAPGAIMWPEDKASLTQQAKDDIVERIALNRPGSPDDIARAIRFLLIDAPYITGQIIPVDGGRTLNG